MIVGIFIYGKGNTQKVSIFTNVRGYNSTIERMKDIAA